MPKWSTEAKNLNDDEWKIYENGTKWHKSTANCRHKSTANSRQKSTARCRLSRNCLRSSNTKRMMYERA